MNKCVLLEIKIRPKDKLNPESIFGFQNI